MMKSQSSIKGLSAIEQQNDKDQNQNIRMLLAKLSNQQFLSSYFQLQTDFNIAQQYKDILYVPVPECYVKMQWGKIDQKEDLFKKEVKSQILNGFNARLQFIQKEDLRQMAERKIKELVEKQQLSNSRKKKQESFYEQLKSSRKNIAESYFTHQEVSESPSNSNPNNSNENSPTKDMMTELSSQDLFLRLQILGEKRDLLKRTWYSLSSSKKPQQRRRCFQQWRKHHKIMQQLLKLLLQKLNKQIGTIQVFNKLSSSQTSLLSKSSFKSKSMLQYERTLASTRIDRNLSHEQTKIMNRFNVWNNKLSLDQRTYIDMLRID